MMPSERFDIFVIFFQVSPASLGPSHLVKCLFSNAPIDHHMQGDSVRPIVMTQCFRVIE